MATLKDVTIVIPLYVDSQQKLQWARQSVRSALDQGCQVVIWDDGSPMDPKSVVEGLSGFTMYGSKKVGNRGVGFARNRAVECATTELVLPLDCDDMLVTGAVSEFLRHWDGKTPVYSDVEFIGDRKGVYTLKSFSCQELMKAVGLAAVTVLHKKEQWEEVGGWHEDVQLYEDGIYNAELMSRYCGKRISKPLLVYRQHGGQRSRREGGYHLARKIHTEYISKIEVNDMCCGNKRQKSTNSSPPPQETTTMAAGTDETNNPNFFHRTSIQQTQSLPGSEEERVRARYYGGKGKGTHYYRGRFTGFNYRVSYGAELMVDPRDCVFEEGHIGVGSSLLLGLERPKEKEDEKSQSAPQFFRPEDDEEDEHDREPRPEVMTRQPIEEDYDEFLAEDFEDEDLPNISELTINELEELVLTVPEAKMLLDIEKNDKNRKGAIRFLEGIVYE